MKVFECDHCKKQTKLYNKSHQMTDAYLNAIDFTDESELKLNEECNLYFLKDKYFCSLKCFAEYILEYRMKEAKENKEKA